MEDIQILNCLLKSKIHIKLKAKRKIELRKYFSKKQLSVYLSALILIKK